MTSNNNEITIKTIEDKEVWEKAIAEIPEANFLQSWNWGVFQKALGKKVYPLQLIEKGRVLGIALAIVEEAKRGNYITIAGGPLLDWENKSRKKIFLELLSYLKTIAKEEKVHFIRLRLQEEENQELQKLMSDCGLKKAPMHLTADLTLQLDLELSEDELLKQMKKNHRYEIRKAQKENIEIKLTQNLDEIDQFYEEQLAVAEKQGFVPFSKQFLKEQFRVFANDDQAALIHAFKDGKLLATAFILFYGNEAVYHYGISTDLNHKYPGSTACQWAAILEAKKRGLKRYNFWGINPKDENQHRFAGVGRFKRGFGGQEVQYLAAYDYPTSNFYPAIRFFELLRKKIRKL